LVFPDQVKAFFQKTIVDAQGVVMEFAQQTPAGLQDFGEIRTWLYQAGLAPGGYFIGVLFLKG